MALTEVFSLATRSKDNEKLENCLVTLDTKLTDLQSNHNGACLNLQSVSINSRILYLES